MKITNQDLQFLKMFVSMSTTGDPTSEGISIKLKDKKLTFSQYTMRNYYFAITTEIGIDSDEELDVVWNVRKLMEVIEALKEVKLTQSGIETDTGYFKFNKMDLDMSNIIPGDKPIKVFKVKDFNKVFIAKNYTIQSNRSQDQFENIMIYNNEIFASDKIVLYQDSIDVPDIEKPLYINPGIIKALAPFEDCDYEIELYEKDYWVLHNVTFNTRIYMNYLGYKPICFRDENYSKSYNHKDFILFSKKEFYDKLKLLYIYAKDNEKISRIYLTFKDKKMILENRDGVLASDYISCEYPESFEGKTICISSAHVMRFAELFEDKIKVYLQIDESLRLLVTKFERNLGDERDNRLVLYLRLIGDA